jgi:hypothetical protein
MILPARGTCDCSPLLLQSIRVSVPYSCSTQEVNKYERTFCTRQYFSGKGGEEEGVAFNGTARNIMKNAGRKDGVRNTSQAMISSQWKIHIYESFSQCRRVLLNLSLSK